MTERDDLLKSYHVDRLIAARAKQMGIDDAELVDTYYNGLLLLLDGPNVVVRAYRYAIDPYHVGEGVLKGILFRGHLRARYHSYAPLIHIDITGHSRGGKDKLIARFFAFIPDGVGESYSSTSSKAPYYAMRKAIKNAQGQTTGYEENPHFYSGKVIAISEVADAQGWTGLKALAEDDEYSKRKHVTVVNGVFTPYSIVGPRCVIILSVKGIPDSETLELLNRFIQGPIEEKTPENQQAKSKRMFENYARHSDVRDEDLVKYVKAALDIVYFNGFKVIFDEPTEEASALIEALRERFTDAGFNLTQLGQLYSLCECAAFQKRFYRDSPNVCRIEVEDVQESWFLLNHFARETVTKLTPADLHIFDNVEPLTDDELIKAGFDPDYYGSSAVTKARDREIFENQLENLRYPTQADIIRRTGRSKGTVSDALKAGRPGEASGKLVRSGLVYGEYNQQRNAVVYRKTSSADNVPKAGGLASCVVGTKPYYPRDPSEFGEFGRVRKNLANHSEAAVISILDSIKNKDILYYSSESSQKYEGDTNTDTPSSTCIAEARTSEHEGQEGQEEAQTANNSQNEFSQFGNELRTPANSANSAELPPLIREILVAAKKAGMRIDNNSDQLAQATAIKIKQQHPEWKTYDVLGFYKKLEENDTEIQGLIADLTGDMA
ncbi:MAG: hypothetical protein ABSE80_02225 [Halobacteriota archaeon]